MGKWFRCDGAEETSAHGVVHAYSGDRAGLPGFVPSPDVACSAIGAATFTLVTSSPTASLVCIYSSPPSPGEPNLVCS